MIIVYNCFIYVKKSIFIFLCLICTSGFSQQVYKFDTAFEYESYPEKNEKDKYQKVFLVNSANQTYVLKFNRSTEYFFATLSDYKNRNHYTFEVTEKKVNGKEQLEFKYLSSSTWKEDKERDVKTIWQLDKLPKENSFQINIQDKTRSKFYYQTIILHLKPDTINYFPAFRMGQMHPFEGNLNISINDLGVVDYAEITYMKMKGIVKLESTKQINLEITIPLESK